MTELRDPPAAATQGRGDSPDRTGTVVLVAMLLLCVWGVVSVFGQTLWAVWQGEEETTHADPAQPVPASPGS